MTVGAVSEEYLTTEEVSEEYRVAQSTLRYWRHTGEGPRSFKLGRRVVYRRSDVEQWVSARERETSRGGMAVAAVTN